MRLIQALRFTKHLNESNIGEVIGSLKKIETSGNDITDRQKSKIDHIINVSVDDINVLMKSIGQAGITPKINGDVYDHLETKIENIDLWHKVFNIVFGKDKNGVLNRDKIGITMADFPENKSIDIIKLVKSKYKLSSDVDPILDSLITFASGGNKTSQGPAELFLSLFSKGGKLSNEASAEGKGDIIIDNTPIEIKCATAAKDSNAGLLTSQKPMKPLSSVNSDLAKTMKDYFVQLQQLNPEFKPEEYKVTSIAYKNTNRKDKLPDQVDYRILSDAKKAYTKQNEKKLKDLVIITYKKAYCAPFVSEEQFNEIHKIIDEATKNVTLGQMLKNGYILSPENRKKMLMLWAALFLKFYKNQEGFKGILIGTVSKSENYNRFVHISSSTIDGPIQNLIQIFAQGKINLVWPRPDLSGRGAVVGVYAS